MDNTCLLFRATEKVAKRSRAFEKRGKQNLFTLKGYNVLSQKDLSKRDLPYSGLLVHSFTLHVHELLRSKLYSRCK